MSTSSANSEAGQSFRITRGCGLRLFREDGTELLDAISGTFNLPLGYNHPVVLSAVQRQLSRLTHLNSELVAPEAGLLADRLISFAPKGINAAWLRDITGSTAIECAIKIAQRSTGATDVLSLFFSHHGQTHITTAISGTSSRRRGFTGASWGYSVRVPAPYCYRCFYKARYPVCQLLCVERINDFIRHSSSGW